MIQFKATKRASQRPFVKKPLRITLIILTVLILILFLPWQQTVKGIGTLIALNPIERNYNIVATVDGFIEKIYIKENQFIKKGQKLFKMSDRDINYSNRLFTIRDKSQQKYNNTILGLSNLEENLLSQENIFEKGISIFNKETIQLQNSLLALKKQEIVLKNKNGIELSNYNRYKRLFKDGIESKREVELKYNDYLDTNAQYQKILTEINNNKQALHILKEKNGKFINEIKLKINAIKNNILTTKNIANTLKQNIELDSTNISRYMSTDVVAKTDGYVIRIHQNDQNKLLKPGEIIMQFAPIVTQRALRLKVTSFNMPLIQKGLPVRIMFHGWPGIQVPGWPKVSHGTNGGIIKTVEQTSHEQGMFYANIVEDIDDFSWPPMRLLKVGTQATIWVRLSTVPIWYEIWRLMSVQPPKLILPK